MNKQLQQFADHLDRYGSDLDTWPMSLRAAARQLLAQQVDAEHLWQQARRLDEDLGRLACTSPDPDLVQAVVAAIPTHPRGLLDRSLDWLLAPGILAWRPVALAMVPVIIGFLLGAGLDGTANEVTNDPYGLIYASGFEDPLFEGESP